MRLIDYMRARKINDVAMAERVGGVTEHGIRKIKYGERAPSLALAIRVNRATAGKVGLKDWDRETPRASALPEAHP